MLLFLGHLVNIENLRILFRLFYSLSFFNFSILRNRATSYTHQIILLEETEVEHQVSNK